MLVGMRRKLLGLLLVVGSAACRAYELAPLPLDITVTTNKPSAAIGDSVSFVVVTHGGSLTGVEGDYGDGSGALFATSGARTATITFKHAYATRGSFSAGFTVTDATAGQKTAKVDVIVN